MIIRFLLNFAITVFIILVFVVGIFGFPRPETVLSVQAQTNVIRFEVTNPEASAFRISNVHIEELTDEGWKSIASCFSDPVGVSPALSDKVTYLIDASGNLIIVLMGEGRVSGNAFQTIELDASEAVRLTYGAEECDAKKSVRLPTNGFLEVGDEPIFSQTVESANAGSREPDVLQIYARSIRSFLGVPLTFGLFEPGRLYLADTFELPPSTQIAEAVFLAGEERKKAFWWGNASYLPGRESAELFLAASANADQIVIYNLALDDDRAETGKLGQDVISLTQSAVLLGDPNLRILYALLALIALVRSIIPRIR